MPTDIHRIVAHLDDIGRPADRPPKSNWKIRMIKRALKTLQHASPNKTAEIIWYYFTTPGKAIFYDHQQELLGQAEMGSFNYHGDRIVTYRWGNVKQPKILFCHGWRSKTIDFRRAITRFLDAGYCVEGLDLRAHGKSEGKQSSLPEYCEILKTYFVKHAPYEAVISYSFGGLASGIALSEITPALHPKQLFWIATPPYIEYFFEDLINELGYSRQVFQSTLDLVAKHYYEPAKYFDLRDKTEALAQIDTHVIHCEDDVVVPFHRGKELLDAYVDAHFVHTKGLGHYKILMYDEVIDYLFAHVHQKSASLL